MLICSALTFSREHVEADSSARPVAHERLLQLRQHGEPLLSGKFLVRGLIYYTRLPVAILASKAQPFWAAHPLPVVVWKSEWIGKIPGHASHRSLRDPGVPEWQTLSKNPAFADQDALEDSGPNVLVRAHAPASTAEAPERVSATCRGETAWFLRSRWRRCKAGRYSWVCTFSRLASGQNSCAILRHFFLCALRAGREVRRWP